mmetsp:Transcript_18038/g.28522  ORF Transcript_18038/g.28522 Transcript_18038/m.28522 type:complete len:279 (+) Transcript_18038:77-913(+)
MQLLCRVCLVFCIFVFSPAFSLNCERVVLNDIGIVYPTEQCYAGGLSSSGAIEYASTSYQYRCVDGAVKYIEYTNGDCSGSGDATDVSGDYEPYCGLEPCDVVHVTIYDGVSNEQCVNASGNASVLSASGQMSAALLLNYCNPMAEQWGLKVVCEDGKAKLLNYAQIDCSLGVVATAYLDASVGVDCNVTLGAGSMGALTAVSAQCDVLSTDEEKAKKNKMIVIIISVAVAAVLLVVIGVAVFAYLRKRSKVGDDKYSKFLDPNENAQPNANEAAVNN